MSNFGLFKNDLVRLGFKGELRLDEPLSKHTYYKIGGPCGLMATPSNEGDLISLSQVLLTFPDVPVFILGAGSNLLVSDSGFDGLVVRMKGAFQFIDEINIKDTYSIRVGSGVLVSSLLRKASDQGWGGLEFLTGVPGSVGGAVYMNAGTHLGETKDPLISVESFSLREGKSREYSGADLVFQYRKNLFLRLLEVVKSATWKVNLEEPETVRKRIEDMLIRRKATQPVEYPSCGSVFKNPKTEKFAHAWQVLDALKLRGHQIGNAQISEKHSNFILNLGGALAADVLALINLSKNRAKSELQVVLEEEVKYLGF